MTVATGHYLAACKPVRVALRKAIARGIDGPEGPIFCVPGMALNLTGESPEGGK